MIRRVVAVKLKDAYANPGDRAEAARHTQEVLAEVPGVLAIEVSTPADSRTEGSWDFLILLRFATMAAVEGYRAHPVHRSYVDVFLRPMLEVIKVWNFELGPETGRSSNA